MQTRDNPTRLKGYLRADDVLLNSTGFGTLGRAARFSGGEGFVADGHITIIRTRPELLNPDYLVYVLVSRPVQEYVAAALVVGATKQTELSRERLLDLAVPVPPLDEQRRMVAALDVEKARATIVVEAKHRLLDLLREREASLIEQSIGGDGDAPLVPLMHLVSERRPIMYGIVLPGPNVAQGVLLVKGGDVEAKRLQPTDLNRTAPELELPYSRARLAAGDMLVSIRGSFGAVAQVPPELTGANITQDVARVAPRDDVHPRWLYHALRSRTAYSQMVARATGATIRGVNIRELKRIKLPALPTDAQAGIAERLDRMTTTHSALRAQLLTQLALLREHHQAHLTDAVFGGAAFATEEPVAA